MNVCLEPYIFQYNSLYSFIDYLVDWLVGIQEQEVRSPLLTLFVYTLIYIASGCIDPC